MSAQPTAAVLLRTDGALLTRGHLSELGLSRAAVDAVFRELGKPGGPGVIVLPGFSRPMIRASDYQALLEKSTYKGDRVRS